MIKPIYLALKKARFNFLYGKLKKLFPSTRINGVNGLPANYDPAPLTIVEELESQYQKAVGHLSHLVGSNNLGDYLEFGVCHGTSLICMHKTLQKRQINNVRLFGFDSFEGLPTRAAYDNTNDRQPGEFASTLEFTTERLSENGIDWNRTYLVKGMYSDTLIPELKTKHNIQKASLINIGCDLYSSAKEALNFCVPLILDSSVIFIDDWPDRCVGEKKAFHEALNENDNLIAEEIGAYKPTGKIFLVRNNPTFSRTN